MTAMKPFILMALLTALSGCVSLLPEAPPPALLYPLETSRAPGASSASNPTIVAISQPRGAVALMGADIVWRRDGVIAFMGDARWPGPAPALLRDMLVQTLEARDGVRGAVRTDDRVHADSEVRWTLRSFEIVEEGDRREARFEADAMVIAATSRAIVATHSASVRMPVEERTQRAATAALAQAAQQGVSELAAFIEATPIPAP